MYRYQLIFYDRGVGGASGSGLPYFEGKIRACPVGSPAGLTRLWLRDAPELGCLTRQSVQRPRERRRSGSRSALHNFTFLNYHNFCVTSADPPPPPLSFSSS